MRSEPILNEVEPWSVEDLMIHVSTYNIVTETTIEFIKKTHTNTHSKVNAPLAEFSKF